MQFTIGDKVIHPRYGPGRITSIEGSEAADAETRHYVIEMSREGLVVHTPVAKAEAIGLRHAASPARSRRILALLKSRPKILPDDFKTRQEQVGARLETGRLVDVAGVVRDLTWRQVATPLTKKDSELLGKALALLSGEMALVSGDSVSEAKKVIGATLTSVTGSAGK